MRGQKLTVSKRTLLSLVLTLALVMGIATPQADAAKKVKLSKKNVTVKVGKTQTIKVKNTKKKAKWTIKKGKKYISLKKKKKTSVVVKGKKQGKAVVVAKIGKKKLSCSVKVVKQKEDTNKDTDKDTDKSATPSPNGASASPSSIPAPTLAPPTGSPSTASPSGSPSTVSPSGSPSVSPSGSPQGQEAVKDVEIDLTGLTTTFTAPGKIDFSKQIESRFDLSLFSKMEVVYTTVFEGDDTSDFNNVKIAAAQTTDTLTGYDDGVAFTYASKTGTDVSATVSLDGKDGTVLGINIQPMNSKDYKWPDKLTSITIKSIVFVAREGAVYPDPSKPLDPTPTPEATYPPEKFVYEGLDADRVNELKDKKLVAFTFDDGPVGNADTDTSMIIQNALVKHNAHATFFYIGQQINSDAKEAEIKSAKEKGFEIGNHSWSWGSLSSMKADAIKESIGNTNAKLEELTGYSNFMFRAPNLLVSAEMQGYIRAPFANCAVDSKDWDGATTEQIIKNVEAAKDGDIVLMHETQKNTAEAIETLLQYFDDEGFQVVSVSEMFAAKGKDLITGNVYSSINSVSERK